MGVKVKPRQEAFSPGASKGASSAGESDVPCPASPGLATTGPSDLFDAADEDVEDDELELAVDDARELELALELAEELGASVPSGTKAKSALACLRGPGGSPSMTHR